MARMSPETVAVLRAALVDRAVVDRYRAHIQRGRAEDCWLWTGAISGKGHGRFQVADAYLLDDGGHPRRRTFVVIAHRFGFGYEHGLDALLETPLVSHRCDNPLCQRPDHWRPSDHRSNAREYARRRDVVRGALADTRGARGRARAVRDAAREGQPVERAVLAGLRPVHRDQYELWPGARESDSSSKQLLTAEPR